MKTGTEINAILELQIELLVLLWIINRIVNSIDGAEHSFLFSSLSWQPPNLPNIYSKGLHLDLIIQGYGKGDVAKIMHAFSLQEQKHLPLCKCCLVYTT